MNVLDSTKTKTIDSTPTQTSQQESTHFYDNERELMIRKIKVYIRKAETLDISSLPSKYLESLTIDISYLSLHMFSNFQVKFPPDVQLDFRSLRYLKAPILVQDLAQVTGNHVLRCLKVLDLGFPASMGRLSPLRSKDVFPDTFAQKFPSLERLSLLEHILPGDDSLQQIQLLPKLHTLSLPNTYFTRSTLTKPNLSVRRLSISRWDFGMTQNNEGPGDPFKPRIFLLFPNTSQLYFPSPKNLSINDTIGVPLSISDPGEYKFTVPGFPGNSLSFVCFLIPAPKSPRKILHTHFFAKTPETTISRPFIFPESLVPIQKGRYVVLDMEDESCPRFIQNIDRLSPIFHPESTQVSSKFLQRFPGLKYLKIYDVWSYSAWIHLPSLESDSLEYCEVKSSRLSTIANNFGEMMPKLKTLVISPKVGFQILPNIKAPSLKSIHFAQVPIKIDPLFGQDLPILQELVFHNAYLAQDISIPKLSPLVKTRYIRT